MYGQLSKCTGPWGGGQILIVLKYNSHKAVYTALTLEAMGNEVYIALKMESILTGNVYAQID